MKAEQKSPKPTQKKEAKGNSEESPTKKQKLECRKIPETLIEPYDLVTLKQEKKKRFKFKKSQSQEEAIENSEIQKLKPLFGECYCSEDLKQQFIETVYQLTSSLFVLSKVCSFRIRNTTKIKLIGQEDPLKPKLIKLTWGGSQEEQNIFVRFKSVGEAYFLFSSMISRKLLLQDFVLIDMFWSQNKSFDKGIKRIQGQIYKISTFMRKWEKRSAKIDGKLKILKQGIVTQEIKSIKQIWTRFDMHNGYFVVKMFEGMQKIELGIPLGDYYNIQSERNWLFLLSQLIK